MQNAGKTNANTSTVQSRASSRASVRPGASRLIDGPPFSSRHDGVLQRRPDHREVVGATPRRASSAATSTTGARLGGDVGDGAVVADLAHAGHPLEPLQATRAAATRTASPPARRPPTSSTGRPHVTTRPSFITATRSHSRSASSMSWVTSTTVAPRRAPARSSCHVSRRAAGSSPWVSSSRNTSRGRFTSASARNSRWRCPPDSVPKRPAQQPSSRHTAASARQSTHVAGQPREQPQRLADPQPVRQRRRLQLRADQRPQPRARRAPGRAQHPRPVPASRRAAPAGSRPSSSCRRRCARRSRRSRPRRR